MNNRQNRAQARPNAAQGARAPQTHLPPAAPPVSYPPAPNAALLIDFDNVTMGIRSELATELKSLLSSDVVKGKIAIRRAYADWRRYPQYVLPLTETSIDLIYAPAYGSARKNATDIRLAIDAMELVFTRPEIGTIVLLSGDSDFSSLVIKLKEYGKYIIGVGIRESSSDLLVQNCDEYYSYNALAGLVRSGDEPVTKWDPWELASEAVARMKRNGDVMRADRLKQVMQEIDSTFEEKNLKMAKFSRFVTEAAQRGLLHVTKLDNGQMEVDLPRAPESGAAPVVSREDGASPPAPAAEIPVNGDTERGSRERGGRRGRGLRGRDRRDREQSSSRPAAAASPPSQAAASQATVSQPTQTTASQPAPSQPAPSQSTGERLTRAEAFDLVRRAVEEISASGARSSSASQVRDRARALLGRDSDSLAEHHFVRILQDAHDADIIDLRRRGDGYEVSRAVPTQSVSEQIGASQPPSGAAAQGALSGGARPAARAGRAGFGKKLGEAPPDLLSFGVVDIPSSAPSAAAPTAASKGTTEPDGDAAAAAPKKKGRGSRKKAAAGEGAAATPRAKKGASTSKARKPRAAKVASESA